MAIIKIKVCDFCGRTMLQKGGSKIYGKITINGGDEPMNNKDICSYCIRKITLIKKKEKKIPVEEPIKKETEKDKDLLKVIGDEQTQKETEDFVIPDIEETPEDVPNNYDEEQDSFVDGF